MFDFLFKWYTVYEEVYVDEEDATTEYWYNATTKDKATHYKIKGDCQVYKVGERPDLASVYHQWVHAGLRYLKSLKD